jgi:hypothetical protein
MHAITPTATERNGKALPKLWELGSALAELESLIADILDADDLTEAEKDARAAHTFNEWLQAGANFDEKAAQVAGYIRHVEALAEARKEESRRLRELAAQAENRASALRRYLTREMVRTGRSKIEGVRAKLSLRRKPPQVVLHCQPEELPEQFVRVTCEPCLAEIRRALKEQPELPWASLSEEVEFSLQIR